MNSVKLVFLVLLVLFQLSASGQSKDEEIQRLNLLVNKYEEQLKRAEAEAIIARKDADRRRYLSIAKSLAENSAEVSDLELSCLLALQAYQFNLKYQGYQFDDKIYGALLAASVNKGLVYKRSDTSQFKVAQNQSEFQKRALNRLFRVQKFMGNVVSFSRTEKFVAVACSDSLIRVWSLNALNQPPRKIAGISNLKNLSFTSDELSLLVFTSSANKNELTVNVFPLDSNEMATALCNQLKRNFTKDEWEIYVAADLPYEKTCIDNK